MARWGGDDPRTAAEVKAHLKGVPRTYDPEKMLERLADPKAVELRERLGNMFTQATYDHYIPSIALERLRPNNVERIPDAEAKHWLRKYAAAVVANKGVFFNPDDGWQKKWDPTHAFDLHLAAGIEAARKQHEEALGRLEEDEDEEADVAAGAAKE